MSTTAEIEARRTAVAMIRSAVDGDREAGELLLTTVEDAGELGLALESLARGLAVVNPAVPPAPRFGAPADRRATDDAFGALVAYIGHHLGELARVDGTTTGRICDRLAMVALEA